MIQVKKVKASKDVITDDEMKMQNNLNWLINGIDLDNRRIEIRGEVCDNMASIITRALIKMSEMNLDPIQIILSSPGGDAYEGFAIADSIEECPCPVNIKASGKVMSAGFVIFLAGKHRTASPHTTFMMHSVSYGVEGTTKEHEVNMNEGKRLNNAFLDLAEKKTRRSRKWWMRTVLHQDKYFSVSEALEIGIMTTPRVKLTLPIKKAAKKVVKRGK